MAPTKTEPTSMMALPLSTRALRRRSVACVVFCGLVTIVDMALPEISIPRGALRSQACAHLEQINPYDGQNGVPVGTVKVIKGLLFYTEGDSEWIGYRNFANSVV